jgi:hypothetical protein
MPIGADVDPFPKAVHDPVSMAMHIHGSFSEGIASMDAHLEQARRNGVDVIWWTDHDFRREAHGYRQAIDSTASMRPRATGTSPGRP